MGQMAINRFFKISLFFITAHFTVTGQCSVNYSYNGTTDTLTFNNASTVSNAHYYWNFGDGSGSNEVNPTHIFPDNGDYLVTLYGLDTVSNCSAVFESWINVTKPDTVTCNLLLTYTVQNCGGTDTCLITSNLTTNCSWYSVNCDAGPGINNAWHVLLDPHEGESIWLDRLQAYTYDTANNIRKYYKEYYKTFPYHFSSSINYENCSSNFEVIIDYQTTGALVTLTAMNKSGIDTFNITGFGNPIPLVGHTVSYLYPYISYQRAFPWIIEHKKTDGVNNCSSMGTQEILIINPNYNPLTAGIKNLADNKQISVYPNPTSNSISFQITGVTNYQNSTIVIQNMLGQSVKKLSFANNVDVSDLQQGCYFIQVALSNGEIYKAKFIKL
jgi:PKD repeat protein